MKRLLILIACLVPLSAADTLFELNPGQTEIHYTVGSTIHTVHGTFKLKSTAIRFDPATGKAAGDISIDLTSGDSANSSRDKKMHKEILVSDRYPTSVFTPDHIDGKFDPKGDSQLDAHGLLRIHGADHEMTLHLVVHMEGDQVHASTSFAIPYIKWGMKNPSNFLLRVDDKVKID